MGYNRDLKFRICDLMVNQRNKGKQCFLMDLGRAAVRKEFIGGN